MFKTDWDSMRRIDTENIKSNQNVLIKKGASAIKY